jgi:hypothetical protein
MAKPLRLCAAAFILAIGAIPAVAQDDLSVWPNRVSSANSDDWLIQNHDKIRQMRPRLLVLNFANGLPTEKAHAKVDRLIAALRESSRWHGYTDADAPAFLDYSLAKFVDLTDVNPPDEKLDGNSTKYPRVPNWKDGINFQYGRLFQTEFTKLYDIADPKDQNRRLSLKELVDRGVINEVWFLAYQGKYGAPFESIEVKQAYDEALHKIPGKWLQAGNGGTDEQPFIGRSLRILFINVERGPGCAMESLGHSLEGMSRCGAIPYLQRYFTEFGGFDLDQRYGLPFDSLYGRDGVEMNYPNPNSMEFTWKGKQIRVDNYIPIGNNVHFLPNGRRDYDLDNPQPVLSTIEHYRLHDGPDRKDKIELFTSNKLDPYAKLADDCMGRWMVYWRQNIPGYRNRAIDDSGKPMKNWWPFLFY